MENKNDSTINNKQNVIAEDKSKEKLDENKEINKEDSENKDYEVEILNYSEENAPKDKAWFKSVAFVNGKYNHLRAKKEFCLRYMPEIIKT